MRDRRPLIALLVIVISAVLILTYFMRSTDEGSTIARNEGDETRGAVATPHRTTKNRGDTQSESAPASSPSPADVIAASQPTSVPSDPYGSLVVHVVTHGAKLPIPFGVLNIVPWGESSPHFHATWRKADAHGDLVVERVRAGSVGIYCLFGGSILATVEAGRRTEKTFEIDAGNPVEGTVVDEHGAPVDGADVWLSDYGNNHEGTVVATSGGDGSFKIASLSEFAAHSFGARKDRYSPSPLARATLGADGIVHVKLALFDGGAGVRGDVVDPEGHPVADAHVYLAPGPRFLDTNGSAEMRGEPQGFETRTDRDGRFEITGTHAGTLDVSVRAVGFASASERAQVEPGAIAVMHFALTIGARVQGRVIADGSSVRGVAVRVGSFGGALTVSTLTDEAGRFVLSGLRAGRTEIVASSDALGRGTTTLDLEDGATVECEIKMPLGKGIQGRVLGPGDAPIAGYFAQCATDDMRGNWGSVRTDAEGRFHFPSRPARAHRVWVEDPKRFGMVLAEVKEVQPSDADVILRISADALEGGTVQGTIVDVQGAPIADVNAYLSLVGSSLSPQIPYDPKTGRFEVTHAVPGDYRIQIRAVGYPYRVTEPKAVVAHQTTDFGTIHLEHGGRIIAHVVREGVDAKAMAFVQGARAGDPSSNVMFGMTQDTGVTEPVLPGTYDVMVVGEIVAAAHVRCEVTAGKDTEVTLKARPGFLRAIEVQNPSPETSAARYAITVTRTADGVVVDEKSEPTPRNGTVRTAFVLAAGEYTIAVAHGTRRGEAKVTIDEHSPSAGPVTIEMR